jgi:hypothetical protein
MKSEPTLNEMCEYIQYSRPNGYGYSIANYSHDKKFMMFFHIGETCQQRYFSSMYDAIEFLFNYYFAVNNK